MSTTPVIDSERLDGMTHDVIPPAPTEPAPSPPRPPSRRPAGRLVAALILIALGTVFLIANLTTLDLGGALILLGLATAFAIARVVTGHYGLAVPAGVLAGIGAFVALEETGLAGASDGWFFVLLGAGFLLTYILGGRPGMVWPLFPAGALAGVGTLVGGWVDAAWLAPFAALAPYWPLVLVTIGGWLLLRDYVPGTARQPLAVIGTLALIAYGILAIGGTIAAEMAPVAAPVRPVLAWPGITGARVSDSVTLTAPLADGATLRVVNSSGRTVVRRGEGDVRVSATVHHPARVSAPEVLLTATGDGLTLSLAPTPPANVSVDYVIDVPATAALAVQSASGDVAISDLAGAVQAGTASGRLTLANLAGPVTARSASGDVRLTDVTGEVRVSTSSGNIDGTDVRELREASTASGNVRLSGQFTGDARLTTLSGNIRLAFAPDSSGRINVSTTSGDIRTSGLPLTIQQQSSRNLTGLLGGGGGAVTISTVSGNITLTGQ